MTPTASCGSWYLQSDYGKRWPGASSWWEYRCTFDYYFAYDPCTTTCDAYCPSCYIETETRIDYFYWNGEDAAFYGQAYFYSLYYTQNDWPPPLTISAWWDAPTAQWYQIVENAPPYVTFTFACTERDCAFDASGSSDGDGWIATYAWNFDDGTETQTGSSPLASHSYQADGTYTVTLTGTDNQGAMASVSQRVSVAKNKPPTASFTFGCAGPSCSFDGSGSADSDGTIAAYSWSFGDGTTGGGKLAQHIYSQPGTFTVALTVTDDVGAAATQSKNVTIISLAARGSRAKGVQKVDLTWTGPPAGAAIDIYRDGTRIASVTTTGYTDTLGRGQGTYSYVVCGTESGTCSNAAKVSF